jgi:SAM-dependent methyltransferase
MDRSPRDQPNREDLVEHQREHFNRIADSYLAGRKEGTHQRIKELIWHYATRSLDPIRGGRLRVLEAMCGYGEGREIIERHVSPALEYSSFDYSEEVVERLRAAHPDWNVWQGDVTQFEPAPAAYDVIVLIGGLHHVPHSAQDVVSRLSRGLKRGGFFLNFEPTSGNFLFKKVREFIYRRNDIFDASTERGFEVEELLDMFRSAGLKEHFRCYPGLLAYVLYYNPYAFGWLNKGGVKGVDLSFALDRLLYRNRIGRVLSFATLTIWRRP